MEAVPAVASGSEDTVGLGDHVEGAVLRGVVGPVEPVGFTGVHLAQVAILRERLEAEPRRNDLRGLDRTWDHAGDQHVGVQRGTQEVIAQRLRLLATVRGETGTTPRTADDAVQPGVGLTVANEYQAHRTQRYGRRAHSDRLTGNVCSTAVRGTDNEIMSTRKKSATSRAGEISNAQEAKRKASAEPVGQRG